ncbi:MAG TPA: hypothetical protein VH682_30475 [Gemmataceae bacterium]
MQKWGIGERQLCRYIAEADELLAADMERDRERLLAFHFAARRRVLMQALQSKDLTNARLVLTDEAELLGLYPAKLTKIAPTNPTGDQPYVPLTDEERKELFAALQGVYAAVGQGGGRADPQGQADDDGHALGRSGADSERGGDEAGPLAGGPFTFGP